MRLNPHEQARLLVFTAAELARRRLSRGARLGATEAAALIVDEVYEWAWDGLPLAEVVARARGLLTADQVLPGVPQMLRRLQVDALFPSGSILVDLVDPVQGGGDEAPLRHRDGVIDLNAGRPRRQVTVTNRSDRVVRVTSHVDLGQVNQVLQHDRTLTDGWRLDIPAGSNIAWEPGATLTVTVVPMNRAMLKEQRDGKH
jgi:urease subunit gamma/beta